MGLHVGPMGAAPRPQQRPVPSPSLLAPATGLGVRPRGSLRWEEGTSAGGSQCAAGGDAPSARGSGNRENAEAPRGRQVASDADCADPATPAAVRRLRGWGLTQATGSLCSCPNGAPVPGGAVSGCPDGGGARHPPERVGQRQLTSASERGGGPKSCASCA